MIELKFDEDDLLKLKVKLKAMSPKARDSALLKAFSVGALLVERKLKENTSGRFLKVRSGRLRSSLGSLVKTNEKGLRAEIGSGVRQGNRMSYADILETGGTVSAQGGKSLAIPLDAARTAAGVARFSARDLIAGRTKYKSSFTKNGIIFGKTGNKGIVPLFVLRKSVTIPAKYWMSKTAAEADREVAATIIRAVEEEANK